MLDFDDLVHDQVVDLLVAGDHNLLLGAENRQDVPFPRDHVGLLDLSNLHEVVHDLSFMARGGLDEYECLLVYYHSNGGAPTAFKNCCALKVAG